MKVILPTLAALIVAAGITLSAATPTTAQLSTIKADIAANSDLNANPNTEDGNIALAALYNATVPTFIVWKTSATLTSIGAAFDSAELANRTTADTSNLQTMAIYSPGGVNPSVAGVRSFFDNIFSGSGGVNTRANLLALWKRPARRIEKLFATGTGTNASPATIVFEGTITPTDVLNARNAP